VALGDVSLRLGHRLVGRAPWSEAVAVLGERLIPPILENLQQRLLDQPVDDTRHAEFSDPAIRLGYFDPLNRMRPVVRLKPQRDTDVGRIVFRDGRRSQQCNARHAFPRRANRGRAHPPQPTSHAWRRSYSVCRTFGFGHLAVDLGLATLRAASRVSSSPMNEPPQGGDGMLRVS
jgi:hypothetical protein